MKRVFSIIATCGLGAATLFAQGGMPQGQKVGIATSLQRGYAGFKANFTQAAEKMPEADYTFKPGSTPEARTFAQVIDHICSCQHCQLKRTSDSGDDFVRQGVLAHGNFLSL